MQYASHALASMLILLEARLRKTEYEFATSRRRNGRPIIDLTMATFEFPLGIACLRSRSVNDRSFVNALNRANNRENRERIDIASRYLSKYLSISSKMETRFLSLKKKKKIRKVEFRSLSQLLGESVRFIISRGKNISKLIFT